MATKFGYGNGAGGDGCNCPDCVAICLASGGCYKISGYTDGLFASCSACDAGTVEPVWDGTFPFYDSALTCAWYGASIINSYRQISGKRADAFVQRVFFNVNRWILSITCRIGSSNSQTWRGVKLIGSGPSGVYNRDTPTTMCDTTLSSVTVVSC